jgi:hypothetical protein
MVVEIWFGFWVFAHVGGVFSVSQMMAGKVTFVNKSNTGQSFKLNLFGSAKNCVKVSNLLAVFKASVVVMADGSLMEADDDGLSVDTFKPGSTHIITIVPAQGQGQLLLPCFLFLSMAFHCRWQIPSTFYLCFLNKGLEITLLLPPSLPLWIVLQSLHFLLSIFVIADCNPFLHSTCIS